MKIVTHKLALDLTGHVYGRWTCLSFAEKKGSKRYWNVQCSCGSISKISVGSLRTGNSKSCGCLQKEIISTLNTTHGKSNTSDGIYSIWLTMRTRCNNPNTDDYDYYYAKGIKVCERWDDFSKFLEDMGDRPTKKHSIDRINSELGYFKENCRWATSQEQVDNIHYRKSWIPVVIDGVTYRSMRAATIVLSITKREAKRLSLLKE